MIRISKSQHAEMVRLGILGPYKPNQNPLGVDDSSQNYVTVSRNGKSRKKHHYITETMEALIYLGEFNKLNLQEITSGQLETLKGEGLVDEPAIQLKGEYKPKATVFISGEGKIFIKKVTSYMKALKFWS